MLMSLAVSGVVSVLLSILIARSVGASDFGVYSIVISTQVVVGIFAGFAMGTTLAKYVSEYCVRGVIEAKQLAGAGFVLVAIFSSVSAGVYFLLSDFMGRYLYDEPLVSDLIPLSAIVVLSTASFSSVFGIVQGCQRFSMLGTMRVASPGLTLGFVALLLPMMGLEGVFAGFVLGQTIITVLCLLWLGKTGFAFFGSLRIGGFSESARRLLAFSVPAVLSALFVAPVVWIANTNLALAADFEVLAYFAVAYVMYQSLNIFPQSIVIPLIPRVSELTVTSPKEIPDNVVWMIRFTSVAMFPIVLVIGLFAEPVVSLLYGESYHPAADSVFLMVIASFLYSNASVMGGAIAGIGRVWVGFGLNAIWASFFLLFSFIMIPSWKSEGLAAAFAFAYLVHLVTSYVVVERILRISLHRGRMLPAISSFLLFGAMSANILGLIHGFVDGLLVAIPCIALVMWMGVDIVRSLLIAARSHLRIQD